MFESLTLDHQNKVQIRSDSFPIKNLHGYYGLRHGIFMCANSIRNIELKFNKAAFHNQGKGVMSFMTFQMDNESALVYNLCNWFSINFVSFFRLTTLLRLIEENKWQISDLKKKRRIIKSETASLLNEIAPEVLIHRNKVAAHLAASDPFENDTEGTMMSSLVSNVGFVFPYYSVTIKLKPQGNGKSNLPTWNLTEIYDRLTPRFWPDMKIEQLMLASMQELNAHKQKFEN